MNGANVAADSKRTTIQRGDFLMAEDFVREVLSTGPIFMTIDGVAVCITAQKMISTRTKVLPSADLSQTHPEQNV